METQRTRVHERVQALIERNTLAVRNAGLSRIRVEDEIHDGGHVVIDGRKIVNMGSCAYLGLNVDPRLKAGAIEALERFGPVFSSSTAYTSIDLYTQLEDQLAHMMGTPVVVPTTTTLGHLSFFQVAPRRGDVIVVDQQAHASIHLALTVPASMGIDVRPVGHNRMDLTEQALSDAAAETDGKIWYVADGVYSMYGDTLPFEQIRRLLDAIPTLHVYVDDAHGFGWYGERGSGLARAAFGLHPRVVIAASLSKSFGSGGAMIAIPDPGLAQSVQVSGGTMIFSGPLHPAELGAAVASGEIHLSGELTDLQGELARQMDLMRGLLGEANVPLADSTATPIWFTPIGPAHAAIDLAGRLLEAGFYANVSVFPAVPHGHAGLRFTQTLYHSDADILNFVEALADARARTVANLDAVDLRG